MVLVGTEGGWREDCNCNCNGNGNGLGEAVEGVGIT